MKILTVRHLQIFIVVAETGTMSQAAKKLFISQPTVSQVIGEMEEEYGVKLFERLSRRLYITDAGSRLLGYARHVVSLFEEMEQALRYASQHRLLKVGASITVGACALTEMVKRFEEKNKDVEVNVFVDNTSVIEQKVLDSTLDLGLVEGRVESEKLVVRPVIEDELVLVCPPDHPFARRESVSVSDLEGQPFLLREGGSGTREQLESLLGEQGVQVRPKWICHSSDAIVNAAAGGQGLAVLSRLLVQEAARAGRLSIVRLADAQLGRSFQLIYHKNKFLSPQMQAFLDEISPREGQAGS